MQCPVCSQFTPDAWKPLVLQQHIGFRETLPVEPPEGVRGALPRIVGLEVMWCANPKCKELVVRVNETVNIPPHAVSNPEALTRTWLARPRNAVRPVDPLVPNPYRTDYLEAAAILDASPRMSAVLARRILGDLLKNYAQKDNKRLTAQIDAFTTESGHPSSLTENLHHFREVGDFGAHTQEGEGESGEPTIIDVDRAEAEWTLDIVDRMFDYFIVQPSKDEAIRKRMDEKIEQAGRNPLRGTGEGDDA